MYSELILSHNKSSPHKGIMDEPDAVERGHNPNCGDDLTLMVKIEEGRIINAKFTGIGCAISTAATSIMIDLIKGQTLESAKVLVDLYLQLIKGEQLSHSDQRLLKDAMAFSGIKDMPARVKCATLGWHCLRVILE